MRASQSQHEDVADVPEFLHEPLTTMSDALEGTACSSSDEIGEARGEPSNVLMRGQRRTLAIAVMSGLAVIGGAVLAVHVGSGATSAGVGSAAEKYAVPANPQPQWQIVSKERDLCSRTSENCIDTGCCRATGYKCFMKTDGVAKCMAKCAVPKDSSNCALAPLVTSGFEEGVADTMFCFSVYTANTGSTKKSHEKELLTEQYRKKVSIFACNEFAVYSDVSVSLGQGLDTQKVEDVEGDFHFQKRKETGAWVNTGMFKQVWKAIEKSGDYKKYAWTVKVDPDAVFVPTRLTQRIRLIPRPPSGVFLVNCKHVNNGFFGNLEVFSSMAFSILVANIDKCNANLPWKIGIKNGKYGAMGEDLFAEQCMEKNGVAKAEAFDITIDGACPADRPHNLRHFKKWQMDCKDVTTAAAIHPFKKPDEYFECLNKTTAN